MTETSPRPYVPALARVYGALSPYAAAILRIGLGAILIPHGLQKLFGWFGGAGLTRMAQMFEGIGYSPGMFWAVVVALTESVGGLLLVVGLFTRPAALAVVIFMLNAIHVTSAKGFFWNAGGAEYSILILLAALYFLIRGGGEFSVDRALGREI